MIPLLLKIYYCKASTHAFLICGCVFLRLEISTFCGPLASEFSCPVQSKATSFLIKQPDIQGKEMNVQHNYLWKKSYILSFVHNLSLFFHFLQNLGRKLDYIFKLLIMRRRAQIARGAFFTIPAVSAMVGFVALLEIAKKVLIFLLCLFSNFR